jgi:phosphatidylserine decarboxylase
MLDSLGSTLTRSTVSSFFTRYGKKAESDELSFEEAIKCLEDELGRPVEEKRRVDVDAGESCVPTPVLMVADGQGRELKLEEMDFSKDQTAAGAAQESGDDDTSDDLLSSSGGSGNVSVGGGGTLFPPAEKKKKSRFRRGDKSSSSSSDQANKKKPKPKPKKKKNSGSKDDTSELESEDSVERVINVKSCPLCHRPRMNSKAEMDIITHLAVCASRDWSSVDKIVVGNFVTASQAQRKWYTRVIGKISSGDYKLGAVCLCFA